MCSAPYGGSVGTKSFGFLQPVISNSTLQEFFGDPSPSDSPYPVVLNCGHTCPPGNFWSLSADVSGCHNQGEGLVLTSSG